MSAFTDKTGQQWLIDLNFGSVRKLKSKTNIDLIDDKAGDQPASVVLAGDVYRQADLLWALCEQQAIELGVSEEQFYARLPFQEAWNAFWESWELFFRSLGRTERAEAIKATRKAQAKAVELIAEKIKAVDAESVVTGKLSGVSLDI